MKKNIVFASFIAFLLLAGCAHPVEDVQKGTFFELGTEISIAQMVSSLAKEDGKVEWKSTSGLHNGERVKIVQVMITRNNRTVSLEFVHNKKDKLQTLNYASIDGKPSNWPTIQDTFPNGIE